jgi:hypothetical protein
MATMSARGVNLEQGEAISLLNVVAAGDTVGTNGTAVQILGERLAYVWILNVTSAAAAAGDLLDVYIDTTDNVSADCAAGVSRGVVGSQFRGRYVITDGGAHGEVFSFTLTGYAL